MFCFLPTVISRATKRKRRAPFELSCRTEALGGLSAQCDQCGALADDGTWVPVKGSYLFPVRALSRHFRGRMVSALRNAAKAGELAGIDPVEVSALLDARMAEDWVVYAKPCLGACRTSDCPTAGQRKSAGFPDPFRQIATAILLNRSKNPTRSRFPSLRTPKSDRLLDHSESVITYLARYTHRIALSPSG